jgi:hypothetical protein
MAKVFKKGGKDLSKPLSSHKTSVVGLTERWIQSWTPLNTVDNVIVNKKVRKIPPILYSKYKDIPDPKGNKLKPDWEPDFVKYFKDQINISNVMKYIINRRLFSHDNNPLLLLGWRINKGIGALDEPCLICGATHNIEMHHVKSLKNLKPLKNKYKDKNRTILRKQIPLCRRHHLQIHNYNWKNSPIPIKQFILESAVPSGRGNHKFSRSWRA